MGEPFRIPDRHRAAAHRGEAGALQSCRFQAASACLNSLPTDLPWKFLAELAPMLQSPGFTDLLVSPDENPLLNELSAGMARGPDPADPSVFARYLSAAMFYFRPYELPCTPPTGQLPLWIRIPYVKWSLIVPRSFDEAHEPDEYLDWLQRWLEVLADEFIAGRGLKDVPEYQRPRIARAIAYHFELLQVDLPPIVGPRHRSILSALQSYVIALNETAPARPLATL